jgi:hypothetical protein
MVKQAEKVRRRSPLLPVFGLLLAAGLFVLAYIVVDAITPIRKVIESSGSSAARLIFAGAIWLGLLAASVFLVAVLAGKDPESAQNIKLPPRERDIKGRRR